MFKAIDIFFILFPSFLFIYKIERNYFLALPFGGKIVVKEAKYMCVCVDHFSYILVAFKSIMFLFIF